MQHFGFRPYQACACPTTGMVLYKHTNIKLKSGLYKLRLRIIEFLGDHVNLILCGKVRVLVVLLRYYSFSSSFSVQLSLAHKTLINKITTLWVCCGWYC